MKYLGLAIQAVLEARDALYREHFNNLYICGQWIIIKCLSFSLQNVFATCSTDVLSLSDWLHGSIGFPQSTLV